jgi:GNAT superfamily N-acetyltransferase
MIEKININEKKLTIKHLDNGISDYTKKMLKIIGEELRKEYPRLNNKEVGEIFARFNRTVKCKTNTYIFIALEDESILGFVIILFEPKLKYMYLDYIHILKEHQGKGLGHILYEKTRSFSKEIGATGILMDVYTDDSDEWKDENKLTLNKRRLKFYEDFGALPIINTDYEKRFDDVYKPCFMLLDPLDKKSPYSNQYAKKVLESIMIERYENVRPKSSRDTVLDSIIDDPIKLRQKLYQTAKK